MEPTTAHLTCNYCQEFCSNFAELGGECNSEASSKNVVDLHKQVSDYLASNMFLKLIDSALYGPLLVVLTQESYDGFESWYKIIIGVSGIYLKQPGYAVSVKSLLMRFENHSSLTLFPLLSELMLLRPFDDLLTLYF